MFYNSVLFGVRVLIGSAASMLTAMLLDVDRQRVRAGLIGFNGAPVAISSPNELISVAVEVDHLRQPCWSALATG